MLQIEEFVYKNDSVVKVDKFGYYHCNATAAAANDGSVLFLLDAPGFAYFSSADADHCKKGQRLMINVESAPSPAPAPAASPIAKPPAAVTAATPPPPPLPSPSPSLEPGAPRSRNGERRNVVVGGDGGSRIAPGRDGHDGLDSWRVVVTTEFALS